MAVWREPRTGTKDDVALTAFDAPWVLFKNVLILALFIKKEMSGVFHSKIIKFVFQTCSFLLLLGVCVCLFSHHTFSFC